MGGFAYQPGVFQVNVNYVRQAPDRESEGVTMGMIMARWRSGTSPGPICEVDYGQAGYISHFIQEIGGSNAAELDYVPRGTGELG